MNLTVVRYFILDEFQISKSEIKWILLRINQCNRVSKITHTKYLFMKNSKIQNTSINKSSITSQKLLRTMMAKVIKIQDISNITISQFIWPTTMSL